MVPKGVPCFELILMFDLYDRRRSTEDITTDLKLKHWENLLFMKFNRF